MIKSLPNLLSILRIFLVPFILLFIVQELFLLSLILCCIAAFSDMADGFLARKLNNETNLGFYLDAIADKFFIFSLYSIIGLKMLLPIYIIFIVIFRDIFISGSYILSFLTGNKLELKPTIISKINTFMQMLLILFILLSLCEINFYYFEYSSLITLFSYAVIFTTVISFIIYINNWLREQVL